MREKNTIIDTKEKLREWIQQDRIAYVYPPTRTLKERIKDLYAPNYILKFERLLRIVEYLTNCKKGSVWGGVLLFYRFKLRKLQIKLGFTIPINVFGPGLSIAHYGTIVVSEHASIGCNCRIHVGVNIGASAGKNGAPIIGNNVYIGPGAILFGNITIADNISIGANATVNKSFTKPNVVIAGTPAVVVKDTAPSWNNVSSIF